MTSTENRLQKRFTDTDTNHIALSGVHNALDAVEEILEFTLKNRFKVGLHILSANLYNNSEVYLAANREPRQSPAVQNDSMVLHVMRILGLNKLKAVKP
jgi:hypothetical protein